MDRFQEKASKRKTSCVLHHSESDGGWKWYGRNSTRLDETKDCPIREYLEAPSKSGILCSLKLAHEKGLQFYQTRSHAVVLYNTLPAAFIEKAVCMKTQEELYQKVRLTPSLPWVVLKSNSQCGQQDQRIQEARSSWDSLSDSKSYGETWNNAVDYRIRGIPLSTVEQQDTTRENKVKKLIEKFENHKHKESFIQDLSQTQKINKFSKESQELIADMNNTEIFELCDNSSKQQCPECNTYWETSIICCSCGRKMKSSQRPTEFEQNNSDVTSIPGYVIKKNSSRGAKRGPSERQRMYYQAKQMLKKARQKKHGSYPTVLARWYGEKDDRTSLSLIGWKEKDIMLYGRIDLEKQYCRRRLQKVIVSCRVEATPHHIVTTEAYLRRNKS